MHESLAAIFEEHADPEHCCRSRTHTAMKPIGAYAANLQRQLTKYRELLMEAETADDLPDRFRGKLEYMHQSLAAGERIAGELVKVSRDVTAIMAQIDRVFSDAKPDIERSEQAQLVPPNTTESDPNVREA